MCDRNTLAVRALYGAHGVDLSKVKVEDLRNVIEAVAADDVEPEQDTTEKPERVQIGTRDYEPALKLTTSVLMLVHRYADDTEHWPTVMQAVEQAINTGLNILPDSIVEELQRNG